MVQSARALMQSQPKANGMGSASNQASGASVSASGGVAAAPDSSPLGQALAELSTLDLDAQLRDARDSFERIYFEYHLRLENGSMTRLAERTGIERTHLYRKLKQLGVEVGRTARKNIA